MSGRIKESETERQTGSNIKRLKMNTAGFNWGIKAWACCLWCSAEEEAQHWQTKQSLQREVVVNVKPFVLVPFILLEVRYKQFFRESHGLLIEYSLLLLIIEMIPVPPQAMIWIVGGL